MIILRGQARINQHFNPFLFCGLYLIASKWQSNCFVMHMDMIAWVLVEVCRGPDCTTPR